VGSTWRRLGLDPAKPTFVLFTNVLWDAASAQREIAFPNAVDWVLDTIEWFSRHPDRQLVVKIHPAEVVIGTNQPFASEIAAVFPSLPANVRVVEPQEKVNSWSIGRIATAGLVHTSTPGMELPLEGIPCIVVSRTHYRGKGFTIDVQSREQYFGLLETFDRSRHEDPMMAEYALRYAYLLFERYHLPWDFLTEATYGNYTAFNFRSDEELLEHPTVRLVVHAIEKQDDFLLPRLADDGSADG
jgi:capsule polysaccharide export protein KpsC/LpsZ